MAPYRKRTLLLPAGELRERITFLQRRVQITSGISKEAWEPDFTCWGKVEPLSQREYWEAAAVNRECEVRITIRHRSGVDADMRIEFGGQQYAITSIIDSHMRHVSLELLATSINKKE